MKDVFRSLVVAVAIVGTGSAAWMANAIAQEPAPQRVGDDEAGRLPPGFTVVVTKEQRSKIYEIQEKFESQLADLRKQIATIESSRDQEIEGLLDSEQKTILSYVLKVRERDRKKETPIASGGN
jgi:TolA-binding protein